MADKRKDPTSRVLDYIKDYAPRQKKRLDEKGTLDLGIAPKFGSLIPSRKAKGGPSGNVRGGMTSSASAGESSAKLAKATGKGGRAAGSAMAKPMAMATGKAGRGISRPKVESKPSADVSKPPKVAEPKAKPAGKFRGSREELGDFYLNATSSMFSKKAGGKNKK